MRTERSLAGVICCFILFIAVCFFLLLNMNGTFRESGHSELGLLFFVIPGAIASLMSAKKRVLLPLMGALLAMPVCLILMRVLMFSQRSFWQEVAWLFSAVFWCALGALCLLFVQAISGVKRGRG